MITVEDLKQICPQTNITRLVLFVDPLNLSMHEFKIDESVERETPFLANIAHESGGFHYLQEIASGAAYEGRADLGNTEHGDGVKFKGRGLLQITGRENYRKCGEALGLDLIANPSLLEDLDLAVRASAWWWYEHGLNQLADRGAFTTIVRRINGGLNGLAERQAYLKRAQEALA